MALSAGDGGDLRGPRRPRLPCVQPMTNHLDYIVGPPILTLVWLGMTWLYMRSIRKGRPLNSRGKGILRYGALFILGASYCILWQDELSGLLRWRSTWICMVVVWAGLVGLLAWRGQRNS
jgi:hypothetical protein